HGRLGVMPGLVHLAAKKTTHPAHPAGRRPEASVGARQKARDDAAAGADLGWRPRPIRCGSTFAQVTADSSDRFAALAWVHSGTLAETLPCHPRRQAMERIGAATSGEDPRPR